MKNILFPFLIICCLIASSQNSVDALRFSRLDITGTARYTAMGGSFGALGGEVSSLSFNPAGIGVYRNSEFTFSTGFNDFKSETTYRGIFKEDGRINFNIPNIAYVGTYQGDQNGWKTFSFGINFNRINTFNSEYFANGNTANSTLIDDYVFQLNADNPSIEMVRNYEYPFGPSQAYNLLLIDYINDSINGNLGYVPYVFFTVADGNNQNIENIEQFRSLTSKGNQSETQFTFGGNYVDKLYLGGSIGYQTLTYNQNYSFREEYTYNRPAVQTDTFTVVAFEETSDLLVEGNGVNFKIGAIYRMNDQLRIGATVHSPTFLYFKETFLYDAKSEFAYGAEFRGDSITSNFGYQITTPARYGISAAFIPNQNIALNIDYEYVNYSSARFRDRLDFNADYSVQNREIQQVLKGAHNFRIGAEAKLNPFVVRGGFNYNGNPYNSTVIKLDEARKTYSIGGGYRNNNFNFDVALNFRNLSTTDSFYNSNTEVASIQEKETNLIFTFGWKW